MLVYFFISSVSIALFSLIGHYLLGKNTYLNYRRFYYLLSVLVSIFLPFLGFFMEPFSALDAPSAGGVVEAGVPVVSLVGDTETPWYQYLWQYLPILVGVSAILGSIIILIRDLTSYISLVSICKRSVSYGKSRLSFSDHISAPFTFMGRIYLPSSLRQSSGLPHILCHESGHLRGYHSIDLLLFNCLRIFQWWNPFAHLLIRDGNINLEFIADRAVLSSNYNSRVYMYNLLEVGVPNFAQTICNSFNSNYLKERIMMMNRKKSCRSSMVKYILALPVIALVIISSNYAFAGKSTQPSSEASSPVDVVRQDVKVKKFAQFPGGQAALFKFMADNIKYPKAAIDNNIQGRVLVSFNVEKDGSLTEFKVIKSDNPVLDAASLECAKKLPKFIPAISMSGAPVRSSMVLPFTYKLDDDAQKSIKTAAKGKSENCSGKKQDFVVVDEMPEYPGGSKAMMEFVSKNVVYPKSEKTEGTVIVQFVVETDGSITDIDILRGVAPSLNQSAIDVIKKMPKWKPGKLKGKFVRVRFTIPIRFKQV